MDRLWHLIAAFGLATMMAAAGAHPSPQSEVLLEIGPDSVRAKLVLPLDELRLVFGWPLATLAAPDPAPRAAPIPDAAMAAYLAAHIRPVAADGRAWVVKVERLQWQGDQRPAVLLATMSLRPPTGAPLEHFMFGDDAIAHRVPSHLTVVALRSDVEAAPRVLGTLRFGQRSLEVKLADPRWWGACADLFWLGMTHIAEGSDHLLFLLTLLLPAAMLAKGGKWDRTGGTRHLVVYLAKVVTAFTIGHSLTLILGAAGVLTLPERPVEFAIAASILVAAIHAWRPVFPRCEGAIAAAFGLLHGLAFASAIRELQLSGARLAIGVLAFNLGIETAQTLIVAAVAPLLVLLERSHWSRRVRPTAAILAGATALVWMVQRG
ncbi:MAG: HupE/UreJ family protein [Pseudomonadota bacterium]